jgi:hypothetical protein
MHVTGTISVAPTGSWSSQATITGPTLNLTTGSHILKVVFDVAPIDRNWMDFTVAPTPTPTPTPIACSQYTASSVISTGFASPYDVVTSPSTNLIQTTCDVASARIDLGKGDPFQYIYNTGYLYKTGGTAWTPVPYTSMEQIVANAWYPKTATAIISLTSTELQNPSYALTYLCTWTGTNCKCRYRDSACTQSYWQIQSIKR